VKSLGALSDKILIDCTKPLGMGRDGLELVLGQATSGSEQVAVWTKRAAVFKTLNQTGAENMETASLYPIRRACHVVTAPWLFRCRVRRLALGRACQGVDRHNSPNHWLAPHNGESLQIGWSRNLRRNAGQHRGCGDSGRSPKWGAAEKFDR
jgi:hypothetical protein